MLAGKYKVERVLAAWTYTAATKFILGIRPAHAGLQVDPCIPKQWDGFEVTRSFRGARYHAPAAKGSQVEVEVVLG